MIVRTMERLAVLAAAVWAVRVFVRAQRDQRAVPARKPEPIEAWEGEGGAVPVGPNRTAAAVTPLPHPGL